MALITKIRHRAGIAVAMIAFGLILFLVGGDLLGPNSVIKGNKKLYIGEIAGTKIKRDEFLQQVEEMKNNYAMNFGRTPTENEMYTIRQQAWDFLIVKYAFQEQYDKIGVSVPKDELIDMVQGNNISPEIRQAFTNPKTGVFDREQVVNYLQHINELPAQQQAVWYMFEKNLQPSRLRIKYDNLIQTTNFVTEEEAKKQFEAENSVAEIKYLYIPYFSVTDSVKATDALLKKYLQDHKNEYKIQESRTINYIVFPINPSPEDTLEIKKEIDRITSELPAITDDSVFAAANTDGNNPYNDYNASKIPVTLRDRFETFNKGDIIGPLMQNGKYVVYKIVSIKEDTVEYARASHILIKPENQTQAAKDKAKSVATGILNKVRGGADFAMTARISSADPSASAGGDLGWFDRKKMVTPFSDAVFGATKTGLIPKIVESQFGYHIINVTKIKTRRLLGISTIEKDITPSDVTTNEVFRVADQFLGKVSNLTDFTKQAASDSLKIKVAENLGKNDRRISDLGDAREIVSWAYNTASVGEVSKLFEINENYAVAVLEQVKEEGTASLDDIKDEISQKVSNDLKSEIILKKLSKLTGKVDDIAKAYGDAARVYTSSDLHFTANSLPNVGYVPKSVGTAFSLKDGEVSAPVKENDGIVIVEMLAMTKAAEIADYTAMKNMISTRRSNNTSYLLSETIKKFSDIKDYRYKFF
jgi:peptidyl-prolyl cis-trans isomerase D